MSQETKTGILIVSFGTSHPDTRKKTIGAIENYIMTSLPSCHLYRAWTSKIIMEKLLKESGEKIDSVCEALKKMEEDGITDVVIQPTHIIDGIENDRMKNDARHYKERFCSVRIGAPLLASADDLNKMSSLIAREYCFLKPDETLVLMGHGSEHAANSIYAELDKTFISLGHKNIIVGTVEARPNFNDILNRLKASSVKHIYLTPFMIVAGDHAVNDMASEDEDSWASRLKALGYEVTCHLKGLGEYPDVQKLILEHLRAAKAI